MEFTSPLWAIPFLGIILSMSFLPLLAPTFWNKHAGKVPFFWVFAYLLLVGGNFGLNAVVETVVEPIVTDYIPFIILISTLYIVSGGIFVDFPRGYGPVFNTLFLFFGSVIAGWIGTTGAAMLLIRPFLRANANRKYKTHLMIFFIFLVANIGGAATPLGDPPLFIGFLKGIDFFWFIQNLYPVLFATITGLCLLFFVVDAILFRIDKEAFFEAGKDTSRFVLRGKTNLCLIASVSAVVVLCNFEGGITIFGETFNYASMLRNLLLITISLISIKVTAPTIRQKNNFTFLPIREIAELFAGIFITVTPIIAILHQGVDGEFRSIFDWVAPAGNFIASRCFWVSGLLSSILDNAPTFLIFFHLTSGDAETLMTIKSYILKAFSISTVFMGALTYIGNAPNLMVKSVSAHYGIKPPSFLGYMVWSLAILLPIFFIISYFL